VTASPGESFIDRMILLVEGARRQKSANELALGMLLSALTAVFLVVVVTLKPFARYFGADLPISELTALLVCLAPTTIGGLLSAIGIAGIDRMAQVNVLAMSGRAVEAAGDIDVLLLDKTGTVTVGNRSASEFFPSESTTLEELLLAAQLASLADDTPEGRSIIAFAESYGLRRRHPHEFADAKFVKFTAQSRMSGIDLPGRRIRKGTPDSILEQSAETRAGYTKPLARIVKEISEQGATPLLVSDGARILGAIRLSDVLKPGLREKFGDLRRMGIKTIMVTGDNALTAATIGSQADVDEVLANARPEDKLELIRREQAADRMVGMTGDGTNDAPALAQADVGVVMHTGTQTAKEAGNMVDLDSDPAKLIRIVEIGKQLLITRGALTTFSIANDVAKYFAILPAMLFMAFPQVKPLDVMRLSTPANAILSAVIFNALVMVALIPVALRGVKHRPLGAAALLKRNLLVFGVGGLLAPFGGIKLIDLVLSKLLGLS
jgi:potassium-transporting ATPase ATP-binding subunit